MNEPGSSKTSRRELDLLSLPMGRDGVVGPGVMRDAGTFVVEEPWALGRFGSLALEPGWWRLAVEADDEALAARVELRLSSPVDPMIIIGRSARVFVGHGGQFLVSLVISPWPGQYTFRSLRLVRMNAWEQTQLLVGAALRAMKRRNAFGTFVAVAKRLLSGQPIGLRSGLSSSAAPRAAEPGVPLPASQTEGVSLRRFDGVDVWLLQGDALHADALRVVKEKFAREPQLRAIYADVREADTIKPRAQWDSVQARYVTGIEPPLFLRAGECTQATPWAHISKPIETYEESAIARLPLPLAYRPQPIRETLPILAAPALASSAKVSVIIPTKFQIDLLKRCLEGLFGDTQYSNLEVIIVDNGCVDPRFPDILSAAATRLDLKIVADHGPFNFSRLVNGGVSVSSGEIILLLNDDVVPIAAGWLHRMVESAMDPDNGAVGARLLYPDGSIQHAGVALGLGGVCGHLWRGLSGYDAMHNPHIMLPGSRLAVTGACLAVRRELYDSVGGFDETAFPVAFNDIDFCLRLRALGKRNIYRGDAALLHFESRSRGPDDASSSKRRRLAGETREFLQRWGRDVARGDPYSSPAFDPLLEAGTVHVGNFVPISEYKD